jgi:hypothetical protein
LIANGLVEETRQQRRAGRPIRFYRSRFSQFVIPAALLDMRPSSSLARNLAKALEHARDLAGRSVVFDVDEAGRPRMRELPGEGPPPLEIWRRLKLRRDQAERLFDELAGVIHRYEGEARQTGAEWILHMALADT